MSSARKPYIRPVNGSWWKKSAFYRFYMLREATSLPAVWFGIVLLHGMYALIAGADSWAGFIGFLQQPLVFCANLIALAASLLHSKTWFELAPKAATVIIKGEKLKPAPVIKTLWAAAVAASVVLLLIVFLK